MPSKRNEAIGKINALISGIPYMMLTTMNHHGQLVSRPMTMQKTAFDGALWFIVDRRVITDEDIQLYPQVNVNYGAPANNRYLSLAGTATLLFDKDKANALWDASFRTWFPTGIDDQNLSLLQVTVHQAEYWLQPSSWTGQVIKSVKSIMGDPTMDSERGRLEL